MRAQAGVAPAEAQAIGLLHHVVPRQEFDFDALTIAQRLAGRSPVKRVWQATLAAGSCAARRQVVHDR